MPTLPPDIAARPGQRLEARRAYDVKRRREQPWRRLYNTARWQETRARQLDIEPLCRMCLAETPARVTAATVCDHIVPHRGCERAFFAGPFQSLCEKHHSRDKQRIERGG